MGKYRYRFWTNSSAILRIHREKALLTKYYSFLTSKICKVNGTYSLYVDGSYNQLEVNYEYRITYDGKTPPKVKILSPDLINHPPHTYTDGSLCLYYPEEQPWNHKKYHIYSHTIPWTHEWIYFYERYLVFGEWEHPEVKHGIITC